MEMLIYICTVTIIIIWDMLSGKRIVRERRERRRTAEWGRSPRVGHTRTEEGQPMPPVQILRGAVDVAKKRKLLAQGQRGTAAGRRQQTKGDVAGVARRLEFGVSWTRIKK